MGQTTVQSKVCEQEPIEPAAETEEQRGVWVEDTVITLSAILVVIKKKKEMKEQSKSQTAEDWQAGDAGARRQDPDKSLGWHSGLTAIRQLKQATK